MASDAPARRPKSARTEAWLADHSDFIEAFSSPSHARDSNPDQRLNADVKRAIGAKFTVGAKAKLKSAAEAHMITIESSIQRVKTYFQDLNARYAA